MKIQYLMKCALTSCTKESPSSGSHGMQNSVLKKRLDLLRSTVEYFVDRVSSVYIASLDIRKAFDRVNHYKLYKSLLDYGVLVIVVDILCNWYSKLNYYIKWNGKYSHQFAACSGVRQGSCLSPAVFTVFMNVFIKALKCQRAGCCISSLFVGCILYADDVLLLSPSVIGLPNMLDKCSELASTLSLEFNVEKSHCIAIGKMCNKELTPMSLGFNSIQWCEAIKYLGVYLQGGR